ncbi:MAG TPA: hypothetical protein PLW86_15740 [Rhodocyclaceae bacterium]|nr:hypothetical protein [Rhodocyclaceae bacterium]
MSQDQTEHQHPERRATDVMQPHFAGQALKGVHPAHAALAEAEVETIDMDAVLPPGHVHHHDDRPPPVSALSAEQKKGQLQLVKFKQIFDEFEARQVSQVTIDTIKRGDVIQIKTIVGSVYIRVVDRLRGNAPGAGEILGECRYDLQDQWALSHGASITVPFCTKDHRIEQADGTTRYASRALKMTQEEKLPEQVSNLLRESFFTEIHIHANPEREKLRLIDVGRWMLRMGRKVKGWIDENNRREREKRALAEAKKMQKQLERQAKKQKARD